MRYPVSIKVVYILFGLFCCHINLFSQENHLGNNKKDSTIILNRGGMRLFGTLSLPDIKKPYPLVIIIPGSGPTDRDGNSKPFLNTDTYKLLSDTLTSIGIGVFRYDKRGVGESKDAVKSENELRVENFVDDVVAWDSLFKSNKNFSKIFLLGHSEGSLIGIMACQRLPKVGLISVAGTSTTADHLIEAQLRDKLPDDFFKKSNLYFETLKRGETLTNVDKSMQACTR